MPCYHPQQAYRSGRINENGKRPIVFNSQDGYTDPNGNPVTITIPCGYCLGCRLEKARQWSVRCSHEADLHDQNCFITLTYDNNNLPERGSLQKRDFQLFMKRLRKLQPGIKFYASGEYGEKLSRPHYHACIFGFDFADKYIYKNRSAYKHFGKVVKGYSLYRSPTLERLWPFGFSTVGDVNAETAGYTARYVLKKMFGKGKEDYYKDKEPEFSLMSRGGRKGRGLAFGWFEKFKSDIYPKDFFTINGKRHKPPRYYDKLLEEIDPDMLKELKLKRRLHSEIEFLKNGLRKLERKEHHKKLTIKLLKREYEEE